MARFYEAFVKSDPLVYGFSHNMGKSFVGLGLSFVSATAFTPLGLLAIGATICYAAHYSYKVIKDAQQFENNLVNISETEKNTLAELDEIHNEKKFSVKENALNELHLELNI